MDAKMVISSNQRLASLSSKFGIVTCRLINTESILYDECIKRRRESFFDGLPDWKPLIHDEHEESSEHIGALIEENLIGYARMTSLPKNEYLLSQFLVIPEARGDGIVFRALLHAVTQLARQSSADTILGNARQRAVPLFRRAGFHKVGAEFRSPKTGIIHQFMKLDLSR